MYWIKSPLMMSVEIYNRESLNVTLCIGIALMNILHVIYVQYTYVHIIYLTTSIEINWRENKKRNSIISFSILLYYMLIYYYRVRLPYREVIYCSMILNCYIIILFLSLGFSVVIIITTINNIMYSCRYIKLFIYSTCISFLSDQPVRLGSTGFFPPFANFFLTSHLFIFQM